MKVVNCCQGPPNNGINRTNRKKVFIFKAFNLKNRAFVIYIVFISQDSNIHPFCKAYIASLKVGKAFNSVLSKYTNFVDILFKNLIAKHLKYIRINNYTINLIKDLY